MSIDKYFTLGEKDKYGVQKFNCIKCGSSVYRMGRQSHFRLHKNDAQQENKEEKQDNAQHALQDYAALRPNTNVLLVMQAR